MKLSYKTSNGRIGVELEADTQKDLFNQISSFQEVFDEGCCGKCGNENVRFVVRTVEENDYHELRCSSCSAKLSFGANKKGGGLFPKRKDKEGNWLPDRGWVKWNKETQQEE